MAKRDELVTAGAVAAVLALLAWLVSCGGGAALKAQLDIAAGGADDPGYVTLGSRVNHGTVPDKWRCHMPANAVKGPHRMYRHPKRCSPVLTAPAQVDYDWLYSPPSEGDL